MKYGLCIPCINFNLTTIRYLSFASDPRRVVVGSVLIFNYFVTSSLVTCALANYAT